MVSRVVLASSHERPGNMDSCFPLDKADYLGHGVLWRYRDEHVHMLRHHVALLNPTFLLLRQRVQDVSERPPQCTVRAAACR
jgi:hypothetical protein